METLINIPGKIKSIYESKASGTTKAPTPYPSAINRKSGSVIPQKIFSTIFFLKN